MVVNYENGKIYRIESNQCEKFYIGSTAEPRLCRRLAKHMSNYRDYKAEKPSSRYMTSYEILQYNDARIILIESYPCKNKDELQAREEHYLQAFKNQIVNKYAAFLTEQEYKEQKKEYHEKNRDKHLIKMKEHYITNRDKYLIQMKEYRSQQVRCEYCNKSYSKCNYCTHIKTAKHIYNLEHAWDNLQPII